MKPKPITGVLAMAALMGGCAGSECYRVVDLPGRPARAADQVAAQAHSLGYRIGPLRSGPCMGFDIMETREQPAAGAEAPETPEAPEAPEAEGLQAQAVTVAQVEIHPAGSGCRVVLCSDSLSARQLAELLPVEPAWSYETALTTDPISRAFSWDLVGHTGYRWAAESTKAEHEPDLDLSFRLGGRLFRFGGGAERPAPAYALALRGGLGAGLGPEGIEFRPELVLGLDRQETAQPLEEHLLATGWRFALELSVQGVVGAETRALLGRVELRQSDCLGLYVAAGYQFEPEASPVLSVGLSAGPMLLALVGLTFLYAASD
ncbi:MAG: hypothetical protein JXR96_05295 [Deltaproteobacteria bacterium]|nr:hypothetical protein [Deltaproteobacteria bacterium]